MALSHFKYKFLVEYIYVVIIKLVVFIISILIQDHCKKEKAERWIHYRPSLFQHIGTHSSLKGKVQKLKVISKYNLILF